ncbi:hypothetical protein HYW76_05495 [Candidatus Pacearchaeota archaeon]|nr:hypothetical protein [Candidatus Pacearchaeota archaeon]
MQEITNQTLQEIEKRFKTDKGYVGHFNGDNTIYCPQVNGLVNLCLRELGFSEKARTNSQNFLKSPSFDRKRRLFYREVDTEGNILASSFNTCKNAVFALNLALNGLKKEAHIILEHLSKSPLYFKEAGLYAREYNSETGEINPLLITQSNLWIAIAYSTLGQNEEARRIVRSLEKIRYSQDCRLFNSQDCRSRRSKERFFADDQALAIITYSRLGEREKATNLTEVVLRSSLYDAKTGLFNSSFSGSDIDSTKSTYKNSLMAQALAKTGFIKELKIVQEGLVKELYNFDERLFDQTTKDKTKVPDNSALALVALEY